MTEIRIHGRGGQGGVTLAKIIATIHFLKGKSAQAFGLYAAERSGAPLQAFVRIDEQEITSRNLVYQPDFVVVIDPALLGDAVIMGLKPGGWIIINTPQPPEDFAAQLPGFRIATINATDIAADHGLGTRTVPIVNTTMAGTYARVFEVDMADVAAAFEHMQFPAANLESAKVAYRESSIGGAAVGEPKSITPPDTSARIPGLIDGNYGSRPKVHTSSWATQRPQHAGNAPPCNCVCPAGNDVRGFLALLREEKVDEALALLHETTPLPGVCGRVCPAPCIENCNRQHYDSAVNVRELERYAADHGQHVPKPAKRRAESAAVIGSGPGGLSAAYHLAKLGYRVELFEAGPELGGVMRTGIPPYRLPRDVLDREIDMILDLGVEAHTNHRVGRPELVELTRKHAALYVATGLQEVRALNVSNLDPRRTIEGIDFLDRANRREISLDGEDVVVIGGGNTAFDAARTALRIGAKSVRIVYRRTRNEMPAINEEIDEGIAEGVEVDYLAAPLAFESKDGRNILTCQRNQLGEPDASGRRRPEPVAGSEYQIPCDRLIPALGQTGDLSILPEGAEIKEHGRLVGYAEAPIFIGGDLSTNDGTVSAAIGNGRRCALHIHRVLAGEDLFPPQLGEPVRYESLNTNYFRITPAAESRHLDPQTRRYTFEEVQQGLADTTEAERCLSCGVCNTCGVCSNLCPEGTMVLTGDRYEFNYDHCKGCGVCAAECPRNVIMMTHL